jgi:hypothetical protein
MKPIEWKGLKDLRLIGGFDLSKSPNLKRDSQNEKEK